MFLVCYKLEYVSLNYTKKQAEQCLNFQYSIWGEGFVYVHLCRCWHNVLANVYVHLCRCWHNVLANVYVHLCRCWHNVFANVYVHLCRCWHNVLARACCCYLYSNWQDKEHLSKRFLQRLLSIKKTFLRFTSYQNHNMWNNARQQTKYKCKFMVLIYIDTFWYMYLCH